MKKVIYFVLVNSFMKCYFCANKANNNTFKSVPMFNSIHSS